MNIIGWIVGAVGIIEIIVLINNINLMKETIETVENRIRDLHSDMQKRFEKLGVPINIPQKQSPGEE